MPPIIAAGLVSVGVSATIATIVSNVIVSIAISFIASALLPKPKTRPFNAVDQGRQETVRQPVVARRVIYGTAKVSGPIIYAESYDITGTTKNAFMSLVIVMAGHETDGVTEYWLDDELVTLSSNAVDNSRFRSAADESRAWVYHHDGGPNQSADAELLSVSDGKWTAFHRLRGITYSHLQLRWDADVWDQTPKLRIVLRGSKVFDPRDSSTTFQANPALCLRDLLVTHLGYQASEIDDTTVIAAANVCDETVALAGGGTEPRYTVNGTFDLDQAPSEVIDKLISAMAGTLLFTGGKWEVHAGATASAVLTVTDDDLAGGMKVTPRASRRDLFNAVKPIFSDPAQDYQPTTAPLVTNTTYETEDGSQIVKNLELPFTASSATAQRVGKIELERGRLSTVLNERWKLSVGLKVKAWDIINRTSARMGWSAKPFRIVNWRLEEDQSVSVTLQEEDAAMWAWSAEETIPVPAAALVLPDPNSVTKPGGIAVTENLVVTASGTVQTVLTVDITAVEDAFINEYELQFRVSSVSSWTSAGRQFGTRFVILGVEDGVTLDIRARAINAVGKASGWRQISHTPAGQTVPPADVANFAVNIVDAVAHLTWDAVADLDLSHYRIRWSNQTVGASWGATVDLVAKVARPATSIDVPALIGSYLIKAVDLTGNESTNATLITSTISAIAGLNVVQTETEHTAFTGTHVSTVAVDNILKLDGVTLFDSVAGNFDDQPGLFDAVGGAASIGTYTFANTVDLGAVYTSRVTASLKVTADDYADTFDAAAGNFDDRAGLFDGELPSKVNVSLEVRTTDDDPSGAPTWSAWRDFVVGDYSARGIQFRAQLTSSDSSATPIVQELSVTVDMPDRVVAADDIAANAAGEVIAFAPAFQALQGLGIAAQDLATGDYWAITAKSATGFTIRFFNSSDVGIGRTFDYVAKGYGIAA